MHAREMHTASAFIGSVDSLLQSGSNCGHGEDTTTRCPQHAIRESSSRMEHMNLGAF